MSPTFRQGKSSNASVYTDWEMMLMAFTWDDQINTRGYNGAAAQPHEETIAWLPDPPERASHG
jgi:hypothetical protein